MVDYSDAAETIWVRFVTMEHRMGVFGRLRRGAKRADPGAGIEKRF